MVVDDLRMAQSNQLETLSGKRTGQWSIRINDQVGLTERIIEYGAKDAHY